LLSVPVSLSSRTQFLLPVLSLLSRYFGCGPLFHKVNPDLSLSIESRGCYYYQALQRGPLFHMVTLAVELRVAVYQ
jgi:hypothetical protein